MNMESDDESPDDPVSYVDTPYGMVTAQGRWYHIPEEDVRAYAGEVFDYVSLDQLLQWSDTWGRSPRTVGVWTLPLLLWGLSPEWAGLSVLALFTGWALASPGLPSIVGARIGAVLEHPVVQALYYVVVLSALAALQQYTAVVVGLIGFVLFRWGIVEWVFRPALRPVWRLLYPLPVTDQILRGLIVRVAMKHRLGLPQLDAMTKDIIENWTSHTDKTSPQSRSEDS